MGAVLSFEPTPPACLLEVVSENWGLNGLCKVRSTLQV